MLNISLKPIRDSRLDPGSKKSKNPRTGPESNFEILGPILIVRLDFTDSGHVRFGAYDSF